MDEFEDNDFDIEPPPDKEQEEQEEEEIKEQEIQDEETVNRKQKLKAALHYFIGKICEKEFNTGISSDVNDLIGVPMQITRPAISAVTELTFGYAETLGADLETFAHHAKRKTIQNEDVRLCARRSEELSAKIADYMKKLAASEKKGTTASKKRKESEAAEEEMEEDEDKKKKKKSTEKAASTAKKPSSSKGQVLTEAESEDY